MSARSTDRSCATGLLVLAGCAMLAACSSSGPRESDGRDRQAREVAAGESAVTGDAATGDAASATESTVPGAALVSHERGVAAMAAEDWIEAELELEQLIAAYPGYPGPYVNLAIVYRRDGRDDDARAMLERALEIAPDHPAASNQLGMLLRDAGEFAAAETAYRRAIAADPAYALAHYNLGVLLDLYLQRTAEALAEYETFQSLQPEPDAEVGRWIVDLSRRVGRADRVARETSPRETTQ